jgi:uncharacterized protein
MANLTRSFLVILHCLLVTVLVIAPSAWALTIDDIPSLQEIEAVNPSLRVLDDANVINTSTEGQVNQQLKELADTTGISARVVTIKRIDFGQPAQEFTRELFQKWFPSAEEQANQVLIVVATEDHRTAIATGAGVKDKLPDPIATSIVDTNMLFPVQKSNYNQALTDGIRRLVAVATGQPDPGEPVVIQEPEETRNYAKAEETDTNSSTLIVIVLLVLATVIPMVTYYWLQNQS